MGEKEGEGKGRKERKKYSATELNCSEISKISIKKKEFFV